MTRIWDAGRAALGGAFVAGTLLAAAAAQPPQFGTPEKKSWNPFKKESNKLPQAAPPKADPNDPTSLANKRKPDANFYAAWGELEERGGRNAKALDLYQRALKEDRRNLAALLGAARMKDAANAHDEALNYYRQAMRAHPNEAPVYNDLGLSYAKAEQYPQAIQAFQRAIQIDGERALYRNNLANVLIDAGQVDIALFQLQQVHGEAKGHFNLGYLLAQKERHAEAAECFVRAGQLDPGLGVPPELQQRLAMRPPARPRTQPYDAAPRDAAPIESVPPRFDFDGAAAPQEEHVFGAPVIVETGPDVSGQEVLASDEPLLGFGQPGPLEPVDEEYRGAATAHEAPLSEPILPEAEVNLEPSPLAPGPIYQSPTFADDEDDPSGPLAPVVRAVPGMPGPEDSAAASPSLASGRDGRPALPPRPSAVQLYRQHASHSDQAPTPEEMFPPYDPAQPVEQYAPAMQGRPAPQQPNPHVGHRPQHGHQPPAKRSARTLKNPFSGLFGTPKR